MLAQQRLCYLRDGMFSIFEFLIFITNLFLTSIGTVVNKFADGDMVAVIKGLFSRENC